MAERRMFAKTIIDSDAFLDMPANTQNLYFHLSMRADDDGFINNPKNIQRMIGCNDDDAKLLVAKKFIIPFDSGVVVIKHWKIHNYIQSDRYHETKYKYEKSCLVLDENKSYRLPDCVYPPCIQTVSNSDTQDRKSKFSQDKVSLGECDGVAKNAPPALKSDDKKAFGQLLNVFLTDYEYDNLVEQYSKNWADTYIDKLSLYIASKGDKYKSHFATLLSWLKKDKPKHRDGNSSLDLNEFNSLVADYVPNFGD